MSFTQAQLDAATTLATKTAEGKSHADFVAQGAELLKLRGERQFERIGAQIAGAKAAGTLLPAQVPGLAEFMASIENAPAEFSFSKVGGEVKKTNAEFFADFMAALPVQVKLGSKLSGDGNDINVNDASDPAQLADAARTYMKEQSDKGLTVSLPEAVAHAGRRV